MGVVLVTGGCGFIGFHVLDLLHPLSHDGEPGCSNAAADHVFGDARGTHNGS